MGPLETYSSSCGHGITQRLRSCTNPRPSLFGNTCFGDSSEYAVCLIKHCPGKLRFVDMLICVRNATPSKLDQQNNFKTSPAIAMEDTIINYYVNWT